MSYTEVIDEKPARARPHGPQEYKGNGRHEWEDVVSYPHTIRLRVPGGWLYAVDEDVTFVPVPEVVGYAV